MKKIFSLFAAVLFAGSMMADKQMIVDFEEAASSYTDWKFTNFTSQQTNSSVTAHGGDYFGGTDGKTTGSLQTIDVIEKPISITFFYSKLSTNKTASVWKVQVSEDGKNWTSVGEEPSASSGVDKGTWYECTRDLSAYEDVYVRVAYDGTSAQRCLDDVVLTIGESGEETVVADPRFSLAEGTYEGAQSLEITCKTEGATIYFTLDGNDPTIASNVYTEAIEVAKSLTVKAFAVKDGLENSAIVSRTYTILAGADVIIDFTDNTEWDFPTDAKTTEEETYTSGDYSVKVSAGAQYYEANSALLVGKKDAYIKLPVFEDKAIARIVTTGVESGSFNVTFNIFDGENAVSTEVSNCKVDHEFLISPKKVNVEYSIVITNDNNARFSQIKIWFGEPDPSTALDNTEVEEKTIKRIENGQLVIIKNGVRYNALGAQF